MNGVVTLKSKVKSNSGFGESCQPESEPAWIQFYSVTVSLTHVKTFVVEELRKFMNVNNVFIKEMDRKHFSYV